MSLLEVDDLVVHYPVARGLVGTLTRQPRSTVHAVDGVSFQVGAGELVALVLVTHDLPVVAQLCDLGAVMYAGRIVESAGVDQLYHRPRHPYTRMLFAATPDLDDLEQPVASIPGAPPRLDRPLVGCPFRPRCDSAFAPCEEHLPALLTLEDGGAAACHLDRIVPA